MLFNHEHNEYNLHNYDVYLLAVCNKHNAERNVLIERRASNFHCDMYIKKARVLIAWFLSKCLPRDKRWRYI